MDIIYRSNLQLKMKPHQHANNLLSLNCTALYTSISIIYELAIQILYIRIKQHCKP